MDPLPRTVVRTDARPLVNAQADGTYLLEFEDAAVGAILSSEQMRAIVDDYLAATLGALDD